MKKTLTLLFTFATSLLFAQYVPALQEGNQWNVSVMGWVMYDVEYTVGESIQIGVNTYKEIIQTNPDVPNSTIVYGYFREEPSTQRIYKYNALGDELYYQFDVTVGQTIETYCLGNPATLTVYSVSTITLNGQQRTQVDLTVDGAPVTSWIEGMGSMNGIVDPTAVFVTDYWPFITCFYENGTLTWDNPGDMVTCDLTLGVNDNEAVQLFSAYPNPVSDVLTIQVPQSVINQNTSIEIRNAEGRLVLIENTLGRHSVQIDMSEFPSGVYTVGNKAWGTLLIQHTR
jgi:hypothetical protein